MVVARKWVLKKHFDGHPKTSDIELEQEELPALQTGEILCQALYISVDPYIRYGIAQSTDPKWVSPYMRYGILRSTGSIIGKYLISMRTVGLNTTVHGQQVARVTESKCEQYPVGTLLLGQFGWRTHTIVNPQTFLDVILSGLEEIIKPMPGVLPMPKLGDLPISLALGAVGMPGVTAYFAVMDGLNPKPGETVFVNAAAGAVGSLVVQMAKIMGCRVIGCAGRDDKIKWLQELGVDGVFNYRTTDVGDALKSLAPDGIDCYCDGVGGQMTVTVINGHMRQGGRVAVVGSISGYSKKVDEGPYIFRMLVMNSLTLKGCPFYTKYGRYHEAHEAIARWIQQGKLKYRETVVEGFEKLPATWLDQLAGDTFGKPVVKV